MPFTLRCSQCDAQPEFDRVEPGSVPMCTCGGPLALPGPGIFACPLCKIRSKPTLLPLDRPRPCPTCATPLILARIIAAAPASVADVSFTTWTPAGQVAEEPDPTKRETATYATKHGSSPGAEALPDGATFGRYVIQRELARGGMGIVYVARDPTVNREVALKVLIAGDMATPEAIARFVREARSAGQLRHPHIVAVHDAGQIDGRHFFTMDLIHGRELAKVIGSGDTPRETMLEWLRLVCQAVHHAHGKGIIHRDLKPQNIIIDAEGRPVVMDFGLAKDFSSQTFQSLSGAIFGTPAYMSPEQAKGDTRHIDQRADIYSLGVILYEIVTGSRPFGGDTLFDTMRAVVNDDPRPPRSLRRDVDPDLNTVILRCLEKDPAARYQSAGDLAADLGAVLAGRPIHARKVSAAALLWRRLRRRPALLAGLAGGVIAAVVVGFLLAGDGLIDRATRDLASGDDERVKAATVLLAGEVTDGRLTGSRREQALALLRQLIGQGGSAEERAVATLTACGDAASVPLLADRAVDPAAPPEVRVAASLALEELLTTEAGPTRNTIGARLAGVIARTEALAVVVALTRSATTLAPDEATDAVATALADPARSGTWRVAIVQALGSGRPSLHQPSMRLLLRLAGDQDPKVGDAAARALELVRTRDVVLPLYGLESTGADVTAGLGRMAQAIAERERLMASFANEGETAPASPVVAIGAKLKAADPEARLAAAFDLGRLADGTAIPLLLAALDDADGGVRRTAARSLAHLAATDPPGAEAIISRLAASDSGRRADAAYAAGLLELREAVPALGRQLAATSDPVERSACVEALGRIGDPSGVPHLRLAWSTALAADDAALADSVVSAFGCHKAFAGQAIDDLITALAHPSRRVRESAATALATATGEPLGVDQIRWKAWRAR